MWQSAGYLTLSPIGLLLRCPLSLGPAAALSQDDLAPRLRPPTHSAVTLLTER